MPRFWMGVAVAALGAAMAAGTAAAQSPDVKLGVDAWGRGDYRTAVDKWRPLAVAGDPDAQFNLAQAYKLGRGVPEDPALAESWFRRAALQGHLQAEDNYGLALFQAGKRDQAAPWLEKSAARGEPRAQLVLGTMIFNGDGVTRDLPRAYALMTRASAAGLQSASQTLAQMDAHIAPADRQRGLELARRYEAQARVVPATPTRIPTRTAMRATDAPPGPPPATARPAPPPAPEAADTRPPLRRVPPPPGTRLATPSPGPVPPPRRATAGGAYRIQLGAFRDAANARILWNKVGARIGGEPRYTAAGPLTRLQAGPFGTRAEAVRACAAAKAAGSACVVIAS